MEKIVIGCIYRDDFGMVYIPGWDMEPHRLDRHVKFSGSACAVITALITNDGMKFHKFIQNADTSDVTGYVSCHSRDGFAVLRDEFCDGYQSAEMYFPQLDESVGQALLPLYYIYPTEKLKDKIHAIKHKASKLTVSRIPPERMERIKHLSTGSTSYIRSTNWLLPFQWDFSVDSRGWKVGRMDDVPAIYYLDPEV